MKYTDFTNQFPLQKTLRFELIPQGKTEEQIRETRNEEGATLLERDHKRAENYQNAKKIIDIYHRYHIEEALSLVDFKNLDCFEDLEYIRDHSHQTDFSNTDAGGKMNAVKELEKRQEKLRKAISSVLTGKIKQQHLAKYSQKDQKRLGEIKERYEKFGKKDLFDDKKNREFRAVVIGSGQCSVETFDHLIKSFNGFTTYFKGFNENRDNIYSNENEATAIGNRIVHENLPRFLDNIRVFEMVRGIFSPSDLKKIKEELELKENVDSFFTLETFQNCLNQTGITRYNTILGGFLSENKKEKRQGLNEKINLYNQNQKDKKLPRFKPLYKQILSEIQGKSFRPEPFESDTELISALEDFWQNHIKKATDERDGSQFDVLKQFRNAIKLFKTMKLDSLSGIFVDSRRITSLSHQAFGQWDLLTNALREKYSTDHASESKSALEKGLAAHIKRSRFSLLELEEALTFYLNHSVADESLKNRKTLREFLNGGLFVETVPSDRKRSDGNDPSENNMEVEREILHTIETAYKEILPLFKEKRTDDNDLHKDKYKVEKIKTFLDTLKTLQSHLSYLHTDASGTEKNEEFYSLWDNCYEAIQPLNLLYNKVRNRLTRKPFSEEKLKLNFDHSTLLDGWDINRETANLSIILERGGLYFLAIMSKKHNKLFENYPPAKEKQPYNKLNYKLLPGPNKMFPKVFFSKTGNETYNTPAKILDLYNGKTFQLGDKFKLKDLHTLIDFYKESILKNEDWKVFQFRFRPTKEYKNISEFYGEVESQGYKTWFSPIDSGLIDQWVTEGKLYLFQIYNKDFSKFSKGKPNLHTIYWKNLFDSNNLKNVVFKLNGEAEVFFRPASIQYSDEKRKTGHHAEELKGKFSYPILKDRRYSLDKFQFHVPITLNFRSFKTPNINPLVHTYIQDNKKIKAIGIDRGERHLLYLSLIDEKGNILPGGSFSLNKIPNEKADTEIDYHEKLDTKEKERDRARKSWDVIENIKELKEGYLSQVVHRIARLMVDHQAILVLEDLNAGFKRGRLKVEKQVYQKFEKMLIEKLNYLVFKNEKPDKPGGSFKALQLSNKFEPFKKLGKQSGMIFYVPPSYTSKIDPITGFYNFLNPTPGTRLSGLEFFQKFDSIRYNKKADYFEFQATYGKFVQAANESSKKSKGKKGDPFASDLSTKTWIICSTPTERYKIRRSKNGSISHESFDCNARFKTLLAQEKIDFQNGNELKELIGSIENTAAINGMIDSMRVLLALRYNNGKKGEEEKDYILSPVSDPKTGTFFNSLEVDDSLPRDADANGAYHIAKKGLLLLNRIRQFKPEGKQNYPDLFLSRNEWIHSLWYRK